MGRGRNRTSLRPAHAVPDSGVSRYSGFAENFGYRGHRCVLSQNAANEQPNLKYVVPGDPANSYVIQKLMGAASITGGRMPLNGPYLDDAAVAQVAAWIAAGAPND